MVDNKKVMQVIKKSQVIENLHQKSKTQIWGQVILVLRSVRNIKQSNQLVMKFTIIIVTAIMLLLQWTQLKLDTTKIIISSISLIKSDHKTFNLNLTDQLNLVGLKKLIVQ